MFAVINSVFEFERIFSNVEIYVQWKKYTSDITCIEDLKKIKYSDIPWIIIIDEAWFNFSFKSWNAKKNAELREVMFLCWKLNCSLIFIAQNYENIEKDWRREAEVIIHLDKIHRKNKHSLFEIQIQEEIKVGEEWFDLITTKVEIHDMIEMLNRFKITYDTLATSQID